MKENLIEEKATNSRESILEYDKFAEFTHKYIQDSIARADQKSVIFFTFVLFSFLFIFDKSKNNIEIIKNSDPLILLFILLFILMSISFAMSIVFSFFTIFPRSRVLSNNPIYWELIVANHCDANEYLENLIKISQKRLVELKIKNCYELSLICKQKYINLKRSICFAIFSITLFTIIQIYLLLKFKLFSG